MKSISVRGVRYMVESEDDMISIAHELAREGYSVSEISQFLGISERKAKKYMEDCW